MNSQFYTIPCMPQQHANPNIVMDYIPQQVGGTENARKLLPFIVSHFINVVTGTAITAPRITYLNTVAQNGWINNETIQAYNDVLDMLRVMSQENRISSPMDGVKGAVEAVIVFRVSLLCANDPNILHFIDAGIQQELIMRTQEYANFRGTVQAYRQQSEQSRYAQTYQNMNLSAAFQGGTVGTGLFSNGSAPTADGSVAGMEANTSSMSHYQRLAAEARKRAEAEQQAAANNFGLPSVGYSHPAVSTPVVAQVQEAVVTRWVPSDAQHYVDLYRPRTQEYEIVPTMLKEDVLGINGLPTNSITRFVIKNKEAPVDREKHITSMTTSVQRKLMVRTPAHYRSRGEAVEETLKAMAVVATVKPEDRSSEVLEFLDKNLRKSSTDREKANSIKEAIDRTWLIHKTEAGEDFTASAFLQDFLISTNFVTVGNYIAEIDRIMTGVMPLRVADEFRVVMGNTETPQELTALLVRIDRMLTKSINDILLNKLSLDISIDSFTSDYEDLLAVLRGKYAEVYYESFSDAVQKLMHKQMRLVKNYEVRGFDEETEANPDLPVPKKVRTNSFGFQNSITVTTLDVLAAELEFGFYKQDAYDMPARIMESNHGVVFWYAKSLFGSVDPVIADQSRHFLVTADDECFELHRGLIGKDNFLISRVTNL